MGGPAFILFIVSLTVGNGNVEIQTQEFGTSIRCEEAKRHVIENTRELTGGRLARVAAWCDPK